MDDNIIYGFYECEADPKNHLIVRMNHDGLTLNFSDGIETSIDNIWGFQGQSILEPKVLVKFKNGYEVDFRIGDLILYKKNGEIQSFKKNKSIKGYTYRFGDITIFGWTSDDQSLFAFGIDNNNLVEYEVKNVNIPDLKYNRNSDEIEELSDEYTQKVYRFYKVNQGKLDNNDGLVFEL